MDMTCTCPNDCKINKTSFLLFPFFLLQENHFWTVALQPLADLTGLKEHEVSALRFFLPLPVSAFADLPFSYPGRLVSTPELRTRALRRLL